MTKINNVILGVCLFSLFAMGNVFAAPACGTAHNKQYAYNVTSYGADTQCTTGTSTNTAFPAQGGQITWYCMEGSVQSSACNASRRAIPVIGQCGTANGKTYPNTATSYSPYTQCTTGTPSSTVFPPVGEVVSYWGWDCLGSNLTDGGSHATCQAYRTLTPVNGTCGTAVRTFAYNATSYSGYTQCATGTSSNTNFPAQGGSVSWTCAGSNGGTTSGTCTATRSAAPVNGTCGTAVRTFAYNATSYSGYTQCATGVSTNTAFPAQGGSVSWTCSGTNGGSASSTCTATRSAAPVNGTCGTAVRTFAYNATSYSGYTQCATGTPSTTAFPNQGGSVSWTCAGSNGGTTSGTCTATRSAAPVNGQCNTTHYNCIAGTSVSNLQGGSSWAWACQGLNGGTNAVCSQSFPACTYTYGAWSTCSGGIQNRTATATNSPCIGTPVTVQSCAGVSATNFQTPLDLAPSEQCLWCEKYYTDPLTENVLTQGYAASNLSFNFTYINSVAENMIGYEFVLSSESVSNPDSITDSSKKITITKTETYTPGQVVTVPGISVSRAGFNSGLNQLAYGKTYNWWVKIRTASGYTQWISANRAFVTTDHQWPKIAIALGSSNSNIVRLCSTAFPAKDEVVDPCLDICWKPSDNTAFNFADPSTQLQSASWKCSVCYDTSGNAILCQNATTTLESGEYRFEWAKGGTTSNMIFPSSATNSALKPFETEDVNNGIYASNPFVKIIKSDATNKVKLKIRGSECPLDAGLSSHTIRPIWIEGN